MIFRKLKVRRFMSNIIRKTRFIRVAGISQLYTGAIKKYSIKPENLIRPSRLMKSNMGLVPTQVLSSFYTNLEQYSKDKDCVINIMKDINFPLEDPLKGWLSNCRDVSTLITRLITTINMMQTGSQLSLSYKKNHLIWSYENKFINPKSRIHDNIRAICIMISYLKHYLGAGYSPVNINIPNTLNQTSLYEEFFGSSISSHSSRAEVWISNDDFSKNNSSFSRAMKSFTFSSSELNSLFEIPTPDDNFKTIYEIINYCSYSEFPTLENVSQVLDVSQQQIQRQCKKIGTSFTEIRGVVLSNNAAYLLSSGWSVNEVSEKLGYENVDSFNRMFKKHKGITGKMYFNNIFDTLY